MIEIIASRLRAAGPRPVDSEVADVLVIGAGPAGLAAALAARERGLRVVVVDQGAGLGGTILNFPRRKMVLTRPVELPGGGMLDREEYSKEQVLELLGREIGAPSPRGPLRRAPGRHRAARRRAAGPHLGGRPSRPRRGARARTPRHSAQARRARRGARQGHVPAARRRVLPRPARPGRRRRRQRDRGRDRPRAPGRQPGDDLLSQERLLPHQAEEPEDDRDHDRARSRARGVRDRSRVDRGGARRAAPRRARPSGSTTTTSS